MDRKDTHQFHELANSRDEGKGMENAKVVSIMTVNVYFCNLKKI